MPSSRQYATPIKGPPPTNIKPETDMSRISTSTKRGTYHTPGVNDPSPHHFRFATGEELHFQDGPVGIHGVNGVQAADLLEALVLRAQSFYDRFGGEENRQVLEHLTAALALDEARTNRRKSEGTEGRTPGA